MSPRNKTPLPSPLTAALSSDALVTANLPPAAQHAPAVSLSNADTANGGASAIEPNYLADEVCRMLQIGRTTLFKLVKSGELVPLHITARIRVFPLSTIKAFLASKGAK